MEIENLLVTNLFHFKMIYFCTFSRLKEQAQQSAEKNVIIKTVQIKSKQNLKYKK